MKLILEKYDKFVWRINGTLILFASVGAILVCGIVGYQLLKDVFGKREVHDVVNVDQNTKKEEFLRLGYFRSLKGTDLFLIPLTSEQKYSVGYYVKGTTSHARNYLFFNAKTQESFWVWNSNAFLVLEDKSIHDQVADEKKQTTKGLSFEFVKTDSNSDGVLSEKDQKSISYFDLASKKLIPVVENVDRVIGVEQTKTNHVLYFYFRDGKSYFKSFDVLTLSFSEEKEIGLPAS